MAVLRSLVARLLRRPLPAAAPAAADRGESGPMKVIVGLGNPGKQYEATRHNVGWWVVDHLADVWRFGGWKKDGEALTATGLVGTEKVRLVKPQTFMNLSGAALKPYLRRPFWSARNDLLVIVDEVALPVGTWRFRDQGSAGGHNGLKDVQRALGSMEYSRLRVGIGPTQPERQVGNLSDFVLDRMGKVEAEEVRGLFPQVVEAVEAWVREGVKGALDVQSRRGVKG
ncbi:MAG: aminoacyl-tRNA hydrolase [Gemmatimonadaceae bacterium]